MSQGYRTRHGWTTHEAPSEIDRSPAVPPPAPSWVWAIVMCIAAGLIGLLVYLEAFK